MKKKLSNFHQSAFEALPARLIVAVCLLVLVGFFCLELM